MQHEQHYVLLAPLNLIWTRFFNNSECEKWCYAHITPWQSNHCTKFANLIIGSGNQFKQTSFGAAILYNFVVPNKYYSSLLNQFCNHLLLNKHCPQSEPPKKLTKVKKTLLSRHNNNQKIVKYLKDIKSEVILKSLSGNNIKPTSYFLNYNKG